MPAGFKWWQSGVIYQIYPRSFQDTDNDGVGDLPGIVARLDALVALGIDAIWLSPIFPSPMADFGYDVADYVNVDPIFGSLEDFDRLISAAHERGLRVILDYVPNHSSDQHPWFIESRSSRASSKRDWYVWHDAGPDGRPPNNWLSEFGGSAWSFDAATGQYYYHAYLPQQPDLNWRNDAVRHAMLAVLRFWLDRGVDGFRTDAIHHLFEDIALIDNPPNPAWRPTMSPTRRLLSLRTVDQPEVHDAIAAMRKVADGYRDDRVMIGEAYLPVSRLMAYYGVDLTGFHLPFNFHLITTAWNAKAVASLVETYEAALPPGGWPNWVLGNHDRSRVASRLGERQARVAAMLLLTLRGTPTIYQGDEIGMLDVPIPFEQVQDPWERRVPGLGLGRDPVRTPMQWDTGPNAGFSSGSPWLPLAPDFMTRNHAVQAQDADSMLSLYRRLLQIRRDEAALSVGAFRLISADDNLLVFERHHQGRRFIILLNFDDHPKRLPAHTRGPVLLSTHARGLGPHGLAGREIHGAEGLIMHG